MKKNSLFKVIGIVILAYAILSFIIPSTSTYGVLTDLTTSPIGIFRIFGSLFEAIGGFSSLLIFILIVGAFYSILSATGVYKRYLTSIANKFKNKEKIFLIVVMIVIALISSICGLEMGLFFIFPLLISIILVMGYDMLVALSATFGATIIGMYGATFAGTLYNINNQVLSTDVYSAIWVKLILLILGTAALIWYTLFNAKTNKTKVKEVIKEVKEDKKSNNKEKVKKAAKEVKEVVISEIKEDLFIADISDKTAKNKKATWPITLVIGLIMLVLILGGTDFEAIFGTNVFSDVNTSLTNWSVGSYSLFDNLLGGFAAFGTWFSPYRFEYSSIVIAIGSLVLCLVYKIGVSDSIDAYIEGTKKYLKPALLAALACCVFVFVYYYPSLVTVISWIMSWTSGFNVGTASLFSFLGGIFYVDIYYFTYYGLSYIATVAGNASLNPLISVLFVNMYSLAMLIAPTSVMLLSTLSITNTSYGKWIKYIWKLFAILLVISIAVFTIYYFVLA